MDTRILAVVPSDWHGVRRALSCYTSHFSTPERAIATIDATRPTTVIFGCYQREWYTIVARAQFYRARCVVAWFASTTLNEFDMRNREWMYASLLSVRRQHIHELAIPHRGLASFWQSEGLPTRHLPLSCTLPVGLSAPSSDGLHLGLLGSGQPWKNMETQALAAKVLQRRGASVTLHVQNDHAIWNARRTFDIPTVIHRNAMTDDEYYRLVGSMHMNLIVSFSETYSYLGAESLALGVPILTTPITPILASAPEMLRKACVIDVFDDPIAIADRVEHIIESHSELSALGRAHIGAFNAIEHEKVTKVRDEWMLPLSS